MRIQAALGPLFGSLARPFRADDSPATLWDWDSLRQVDIILTIEEAFGISLTTAEISDMSSIGAVVDLLRKRGLKVDL